MVREKITLDNNLVAIGWDQINDYSQAKTKQEIEKLLSSTSGNQKKATLENWARQLWTSPLLLNLLRWRGLVS